MTTAQHLMTIAVIALATMATRSLPFLLFPAGKEAPDLIRHLSRVLPGAVFGLLMVYCLRNMDLLSGSRGLPEAIALSSVTALHLWKRNMRLSIAGGTVTYMYLVQLIF